MRAKSRKGNNIPDSGNFPSNQEERAEIPRRRYQRGSRRRAFRAAARRVRQFFRDLFRREVRNNASTGEIRGPATAMHVSHDDRILPVEIGEAAVLHSIAEHQCLR